VSRNTDVIAGVSRNTVIAGLTRNPWIPGQARDDKYVSIPGAETPDLIRGRDDKPSAGPHFFSMFHIGGMDGVTITPESRSER